VSALIHRGRRTQVWQMRAKTQGGRLIALTLQTQMTL
jgi:acyl-coenzyme A thioesterase PaaI-like protein